MYQDVDVILGPLITEKSMNDAGFGKFTFKVSKKADKKLIKKVIEEKFGVDVVSVSTAIVKGKKRRFGARRIEVALPSFKKAIVKLTKGQRISMFDVGGKVTSETEKEPARNASASVAGGDKK